MKELKKQLKDSVDGKVMVRKSSQFKYREKFGEYRYDVYFDFPTTENKETIKRIISENGYTPLGFKIIAGTYGYVISFVSKEQL